MLPSINRFKKPKILLVEGTEDAKFFDKLIKHMNIDDIGVKKINGNSKQKIQEILSAIKADNWYLKSIGKGLGILLDANSNPSGREDRVKYILHRVGFNTPNDPLEISEGPGIKTIYMIVPSNDEEGMLEKLCIRSVSEDPSYNCVDEMFSCLREAPKKIWKAYVHAFLATRKIPDKRLGEAAQAGYWPLDHEAFNDIKDFLKKLHEV